MNIIDIRQSNNWSLYLQKYSWKSIKLSCGSIIRLKPFLMFNLAKLQRPVLLNKSDLEEIEALCKKHRIFILKLFPGVGQDLNILENFKYRQDNSVDLASKTMFIDLNKSERDLWKNLSHSCRYSINRANRMGVNIEIAQNPGKKVLEGFHQLITERGKLRQFHVQNTTDLGHKIKIFGNQSYLASAYSKSGYILGSKLFLAHNDNIWYIHGATSKLGQQSKGGYKLLWESIVHFKDLGFKIMDLEGLADDRLKKQTEDWRGFTEFKLKFNGNIVEFPLPRIKYFNPLI